MAKRQHGSIEEAEEPIGRLAEIELPEPGGYTGYR